MSGSESTSLNPFVKFGGEEDRFMRDHIDDYYAALRLRYAVEGPRSCGYKPPGLHTCSTCIYTDKQPPIEHIEGGTIFWCEYYTLRDWVEEGGDD